MLANSENGFDDIISTRSKVFKEKKLDPDSMSVGALIDFIIENPSVLKRPIIINESELQVGYNNEDITIFFPKELRHNENILKATRLMDMEDDFDDEEE